MLPDLEHSIAHCKSEISNINPLQSVLLTERQWSGLLEMYRELYPAEEIELVGNHTLVIGNRNSQTRYISCQEFPKLLALATYQRDLQQYHDALNAVVNEMGYKRPNSVGAKEIFSLLPAENWETVLEAHDVIQLNQAIERTLSEPDQEMFRRFLSDAVWVGLAAEGGATGRHLDRVHDWIDSAIYKVGDLVAASSSGRDKLVTVFARLGLDLQDVRIDTDARPAAQSPRNPAFLTGGENTIFYGAPGTGKSHAANLEARAEAGSTVVRTVFHPDMQNSDFSGSLKPVMLDDGKISYRFSPGPFACALLNAIKSPSNMHWLIIEELNRAPAAAVFGELFLLLDRDENGQGKYDVDFPSEEFRKWWHSNTGDESGRIHLPSNLSILATMNSADQGVFPLDTAFRRRWKQQYVPIDYDHAPNGTITYQKGADRIEIEWKEFAKRLNRFLTERIGTAISEDRLVGHRFLGEKDLADSSGVIPGKLLLYLWDDLLRHHGREVLFHDSVRTYGELSQRIQNSTQIFSDNFIDALQK